MLVLNATDEIRAHADTAGVVHYTIHGLVDGVLTQLAFGLLPDTSTAIYTAVATPTVVKTVTLVNKDAADHTVDLDFVSLGIGTEYCLIAEDMTLGAYHALFTDFEKVTILGENGAVIFGYIDHLHDLYMLKQTLTDNAIPKANGTEGEVQNSGIIVDDNDGVLGAGTVIELVAGARVAGDFDFDDEGKTLVYTGTGATWTWPTNTVKAYPVGTVMNIVNRGSGALVVAVTATDTLVSAGSFTTVSVNAMATMVKTAATEWTLAGGLE